MRTDLVGAARDQPNAAERKRPCLPDDRHLGDDPFVTPASRAWMRTLLFFSLCCSHATNRPAAVHPTVMVRYPFSSCRRG